MRWGGRIIINLSITQKKEAGRALPPLCHDPVTCQKFIDTWIQDGPKKGLIPAKSYNIEDHPMASRDDARRKITALSERGVDTQLSHLGRDSHAFHGFVNPPVVRASTVLFANMDAMEARAGDSPNRPKYAYGLMGTPTIDALVDTINALEKAAGTVLVPSGLAAVTVPLLAVARPGLHVLVPDNVYWPTRRFCDQTLTQLGMETTYYDPLIGSGIAYLMRPDGGSVLFTEAPGSNTFEMPDLNAFLQAAREHDAITMIDNTWATPLIYKPIAEGFDYSIQAGTKYFGGHSDLLIGSISASERAWGALKQTHGNLGLQAGTEEIFLTLRGMRTLRVRLDQHEKSALEMAHWLEEPALCQPRPAPRPCRPIRATLCGKISSRGAPAGCSASSLPARASRRGPCSMRSSCSDLAIPGAAMKVWPCWPNWTIAALPGLGRTDRSSGCRSGWKPWMT
jgi:cystathionine beta-lyase